MTCSTDSIILYKKTKNENRLQLRLSGLCVDCKTPTSFRRCKKCSDRNNQYKMLRQFRGLCRDCSNPVYKTFIRCIDCININKLRKAKLKSEGKCVTCGKILFDCGLNRSAKYTCINCSEKVFKSWT